MLRTGMKLPNAQPNDRRLAPADRCTWDLPDLGDRPQRSLSPSRQRMATGLGLIATIASHHPANLTGAPHGSRRNTSQAKLTDPCFPSIGSHVVHHLSALFIRNRHC